MSKDHLERKAYRKSPGRQYGYDYDPLRSSAGRSQSGSTASHAGALLAHRPDPKRTRQLLRESIIASKRPVDEGTEPIDDYQDVEPQPVFRSPAQSPKATRRITTSQFHAPYAERIEDERTPIRRPSHHYPPARERQAVPPRPGTRELSRYYTDEPDPAMLDMDDPLYAAYHDEALVRPSSRLSPQRTRQSVPVRYAEDVREQRREPAPPPETDEYADDYIYEEHEELPPGTRVVTPKKKFSRRGLIVGAVAGGTAAGVAALLIAPRGVPQVVGNSEHQIQQAFDKGVAHGSDTARRELLNALDTVEGVSLQAAIDAASLTRTAYDVFVSPIITFGAALTADFLTAMLKSMQTARGWLAGINQDNATLIAIQKVIASWVDQVNKLPKQLDAITQTDLDGAQGYLNALKRKIEDEKKKLNQPSATPTVAPGTTVTAKPK